MTTKASVILAEVERNCDAHTFAVRVRHTPAKPARQSKVIAGLLRVLAENTDGWCANKGAVDTLFKTTGMLFHFTSDKKRDEFIKTRIALYLDTAVQAQLTVTKV